MKIYLALLLTIAGYPTLTYSKAFVPFSNSSLGCTKALEDKGYCDSSNPLVQCIWMGAVSDQGTQESCVVGASASIWEEDTRYTKDVLDKQYFELSSLKNGPICFSFKKDVYYKWHFRNFVGFVGECGSTAEDLCDPFKGECPSIELDNYECKEGWPCYKVVAYKSSLRQCTQEMSENGVCEFKKDQYTPCVSYENKTPDVQRCDIRLEANFEDGIVQSIKRSEKLFPLQRHEICFNFDKNNEKLKNISGIGVLCDRDDKNIDQINVCDLAKNRCPKEINKIFELKP